MIVLKMGGELLTKITVIRKFRITKNGRTYYVRADSKKLLVKV